MLRYISLLGKTLMDVALATGRYRHGAPGATRWQVNRSPVRQFLAPFFVETGRRCLTHVPRREEGGGL